MAYEIIPSGTVFGRLTVIGVAEPHRRPDGYFDTKSLCRCVCGTEKVVRNGNLKSGNSQSCGCLKIERSKQASTKHGESRSNRERTPEYNCWSAIWKRCRPDHGHKDYGPRGISVCERWETFGHFLADMGRRPSILHSIERDDVNGNYEPGNCRWATRVEQANNKRTNVIITIDGTSHTLVQWSIISGVNVITIQARRKRGMSDRDAVFTPPMKQKGRLQDHNAIRRMRRAAMRQSSSGMAGVPGAAFG